MLARIFGTAVGAARQRRAGIGDAGDIGIADQRKDGVVEGSGAEFDLAALRRITICREHQTQELELLFSEPGFLLLCVILSFRCETADEVVLFEPGLFHPRQLREELQVAPIAWGEGDQRLRAACGP